MTRNLIALTVLVSLPAAAQTPTEVILDNGQAGTTATGTWRLSSATTIYGTDSLYSSQAGAVYTFNVQLPQTATYEVYLWSNQSSKRRQDVPVEITFDGGTDMRSVNQQVNGGRWNHLGKWRFARVGRVRVTSLGGDALPNQTSVDAVRFVLSAPAPGPQWETNYEVLGFGADLCWEGTVDESGFAHLTVSRCTYKGHCGDWEEPQPLMTSGLCVGGDGLTFDVEPSRNPITVLAELEFTQRPVGAGKLIATLNAPIDHPSAHMACASVGGCDLSTGRFKFVQEGETDQIGPYGALYLYVQGEPGTEIRLSGGLLKIQAFVSGCGCGAEAY